jgi:hypothetical protein
MTASPRFLVCLALVAAPGCLHVQSTTTRTSDPPAAAPAAGDRFASLRPGETVPTRPAAPPVVAEKGPSLKATPAPDADPAPPASPDRILAVVKTAEPGPFPIGAAPAVAEPPLLAAMRAYVENRPDDAIRHLEKLDRPNQDFALAVMPALARGAAMNLAAPDPQEAAHLADQLTGAANKLEAKAALRIEKVAFCTKVGGYGRFDLWPDARPYRPNDPALLYVEVRNVTSTPSTGPGGETYLSRAMVSLEVRDSKMNVVEIVDPADWRRRVTAARFVHEERTRSAVRDYYQPYRFLVPSQPGVYTVTVEVKDPIGGRSARSQPTEFRVTGP